MAYPDEGMFLTPLAIQKLNINKLKEGDPTKEIFLSLYTILNDIVTKVNLKDSGIYGKQEFLTGSTYFSDPALNSTTSSTPVPRPVFRKIITFDALGNAAAVYEPHGIDVSSGYIFTHIYGCAFDTAANLFYPLPYYNNTYPTTWSIELTVDATNVKLDVGSTKTSFKAYVVLEYIKG